MVAPCTKRKAPKGGADLYTTPKIALDAIWSEIEKDIYTCSTQGKVCSILEPCAGLNDITDYLYERGNLVYTNELHPYEDRVYDYTTDFLAKDNGIGQYDLIVSNPPYTLAKEFILKGFEHSRIQWHLLRLSFLEGQNRFEELFSMGKLSDVYIFTYRISCPKGVDKELSPNSVCYAWFRFDKNHLGQPKLHWLTK